MDPKIEKIVTTTHDLVQRHGYRKVTMSEIAEAVGISRPTLYAAFPNKEAILTAILAHHTALCAQATDARMGQQKTLKARLRLLFDVWIVEPFESVANSVPGRDLMDNIGIIVPDAIRAFYVRFQQELRTALASEMTGKRSVSASDLAQILALAAKGLKASGATVAELRRLVDGMIAMAVAAAARA